MSPTASTPRNSATRQPWRVRAVSVAGYRHLQEGIECQDAHLKEILSPRGPVILAVADGAGSRRRAAQGASAAVGTAIDVYRKAFRDGGPTKEEQWKPLMRQSFERVREQFLARVSSYDSDSVPEDYATTLTVAVLAHDFVGIARLGDGFVIVAVPGPDGDALHLVSHAEGEGEYSNETVFLTSEGAERAVQIDCLVEPELRAVLLSTDGLTPVALQGRSARALRVNTPFFTAILPHLVRPDGDPTAVARLLQENDRITSASADDKTLVVAVRG